jgi:PQQ-dependent catabolism-associated CXXCW motif protein
LFNRMRTGGALRQGPYFESLQWRVWLCALALAIVPGWSTPSLANYDIKIKGERRFAFVVGNATYKKFPLDNPVRDARAVSQSLQKLGFETSYFENLTASDFRKQLQRFLTKSEKTGSVILVYYAGHGVNVNNKNLLLPVDMTFEDEDEVLAEGVNVESVLIDRLEHSSAVKILIFDACRDDPFRAAAGRKTARVGFSEMSASNTLVAYATAPGSKAEDGPAGTNSLFTAALVSEMNKPGLDIEQVLKAVRISVFNQTKGRQSPWTNASLTQQFYLRPADIEKVDAARKTEEQAKIDQALAQQRSALTAAQEAELATLQQKIAKLEAVNRSLAQAAGAKTSAVPPIAPTAAPTAAPATAAPATTPTVALASAMPTRAMEDANAAAADVAAQRKERARIAQEREALRLAALDEQRVLEAARARSARDDAARRDAEVKQKKEEALLAAAEREQAEQVRLREERERAQRVAADARAMQAKKKADALQLAALAKQEKRAAELERIAQAELTRRAAIAARSSTPPAEPTARVVAAASAATTENALENAAELDRLRAQVNRIEALRAANTPEQGLGKFLGAKEPLRASASRTAKGDLFVRGVLLPAGLRVEPLTAGVPEACKVFHGAWGQGRWGNLRTAEIWITKLDAQCEAEVVYGRGGIATQASNADYLRGTGRVKAGVFEVTLSNAHRMQFRYNAALRALDGTWTDGQTSATAQFEPISHDPNTATSTFALEAEHEGNLPTKWIAANNFATPLPIEAPGASTITALQLKAMLQEDRQLTLVDTFVGAAHQSLPGAVWLPELGDVRLGSMESRRIGAVLARATEGDKARPVVVFERNQSFGWYGYHAVLRLVGMGYRQIYWFRGGIDAWHDAGQSMQLAAAR